MSPRTSRRALIDPGWPRERSRRGSSQTGRADPLAPPPRREARPRHRRALRASRSSGAALGAGASVWLGLVAFLGAGGLVVLAAEVTLRLLSR